MKRILFLFTIIICVSGVPKHVFSQGVHDAWNNSYSKSRHDALVKTVSEGVEKMTHPEPPKPPYKERMAEREEAERQRQIRNDIDRMSDRQLLDNIDNPDYKSMILNEYKQKLTRGLATSNRILYYFDKDKELRKLILDTPSLKAKVREDILGKKEKILDFARDTDLNQLIMSDPYLRECYKEMQARQDIKRDSRTVLDYIKDPYLKQIIKEDPKLHEILGQEMAKKADEEIKRQKQREAEEQKLKELHDADEIAEIKRRENENQKEKTRIADEKNRANEQTIKNEGEIKKNKDLQDDLLSSPAFAPHIPDLSISIPDPLDLMVSDPTAFFGINYTDDLSSSNDNGRNKANPKKQAKENDEQMSYLEEKWDDVKTWYDAKDYNYKISKKYEVYQKELSTVIKKTPDNARKKMVSIPIDKTKEWVRKIVNIGYPGAHLEEKVEMIVEVGKDEKGFIEGIFQDILDAVSRGSALDFISTENLRRFDEKYYSRIEKFDEGNRSRLKRLLKLN